MKGQHNMKNSKEYNNRYWKPLVNPAVHPKLCEHCIKYIATQEIPVDDYRDFIKVCTKCYECYCLDRAANY